MEGVLSSSSLEEPAVERWEAILRASLQMPLSWWAGSRDLKGVE